MNILYLTNHLNTGGITSYVLALAKGLKKRGHNIYLASSGGDLLEKFIQSAVSYISVPLKTKKELSLQVFISAFKLAKFIKEQKIDIIHANTRVTQVLAGLLEWLCAKPFLSTCHGFFRPRILRRLFPCWGKRVIAISQEVKEHLINDFKVKEEDIKLIYHGIDADKFARYALSDMQYAKQKYGLGNGPVISIIARLSDVKGHLYLIEAMKDILAQIPEAWLLIVGEGKMEKRLTERCQELNIKKSVVFIPSVADTREILAITDIFAMPSLKEGLGLGIMEAMAAGLCVVASDVGGIKSLISQGVNGVLVKARESRGISQAIVSLLKDAGKRKSLGDNARELIRDKFSDDKMILETERVYQECLSLKD